MVKTLSVISCFVLAASSIKYFMMFGNLGMITMALANVGVGLCILLGDSK